MKHRFAYVPVSVLAILVALGLTASLAWVATEQEKASSTEVKVTLDQVPAPVKATLEKESKGGTIEAIEKETVDGKTVYSADLLMDGKKSEVKVAEDGTVVERESGEVAEKGEAEEAEEKEGAEEKEKAAEVTVTLDQVPAPVKATLEKESKGGKIEAIEKETEDGKTVYSAALLLDGKKSEVKVAEDGTVVERESGEAAEKGEAEEAEEKEEAAAEKPAGTEEAKWQDSFGDIKGDLVSTGKNPYFVLEPGYVMTLEGKEGAKGIVLVISVLNDTKTVDGVETRVVEERESEGGQLAEVSLNYFAISKKTNDVYYFGEDSREYKDGKEVSRSGSWESGKNEARFGLLVPAKPTVGQHYYQEIALKDKAMDRAAVVSVSEKVAVPAGTFENCLKTEESSAVERGKEHKYYAPGVGLLIDGGLKLTKYGKK